MVTPQLLEEITAGHGLYLSQLAKRAPPFRLGRPATFHGVLRWVLAGARCPDGSRVYLEAARLSGKWVSTPQALARFIALQTPQVEATLPREPRSSKARTRANDQAATELKEIGI
jgi:hypothetical protein